MDRFRYFLELAYNGQNYHGWQVQKSAISVQEELTKNISVLLREKINLVGCGRTDTGVHARKFYAHFDLDHPIDEQLMPNLAFKLNKMLPKDIAIDKVYAVVPDHHARFSARTRTYKYFIHQTKDPFLNDTSWYVYGPINIEAMNAAAELLMSYTDFTSFARLHSQTKTNICHISAASWSYEGEQLVFTIAADRFLRNMVRAIVGTLVELGRGKISLEQFRSIIEVRDRSEAGTSVPARGLFLWDVVY